MPELTMKSRAEFLSAMKDVLFATGKPESYRKVADWATAHGNAELSSAALEAAGDVDEAEADFNRMCIGPYRLSVPPYESVWRASGRMLNNRFSAAVEHSYAELGLTVSRSLNEPCDFFAYEIEFMYCAAALAASNEDAGETENAAALVEMFNRFWAEHLGHWAVKFLSALEDDARHPFWRAWAHELNARLSDFTVGIALSNHMTGVEAIVAPPASKTEKKDSK